MNPRPMRSPDTRPALLLMTLLLTLVGCLNDLNFDDIEPRCALPRFDVPSRDVYCSGELTTSTPATQDGEAQYISVAALGERAAVFQGTPIDRAQYYTYVTDLERAGMPNEALQLQQVLDSNLPLYSRIVGWATDVDALSDASLSPDAEVELYQFTGEGAFALGPIYRAQYLAEEGDALLVLGFNGAALVQLSGGEETISYRDLELPRRLLPGQRDGDVSALDIEVWAPEPGRVVLFLAGGSSGLKSLSFVWDGANWQEDFYPVTDVWNPEALEDAAVACCQQACDIAEIARCGLGTVRNNCVYLNEPWMNSRECINQTFTHRISFLVSSVEVAQPTSGEARLYLGGFSVELGPNGEELYRGTINTVAASQVDPKNYGDQIGPTMNTVQQILPAVEGMAEDDLMQVIDIVAQGDTLYTLNSIYPPEAFSNAQALLLGDSRLAIQIFKLTSDGLIDSGQPVRSIPITIADGDFTSSAYPELRMIGSGILAMRTVRLKYTSVSLEFGGSNLMIWDLAGDQLPSEPLRAYEEVFTSDNARRAHNGLISAERGDSGVLVHPSVEGLERVDLTIGGSPLP